MDKIDYKKQDKELYFPTTTPVIIEVPKMSFVAVSGVGDPNEKDSEYQKAVGLLYGISFTIKMSKMSGDMPPNYHDYIVPPLEGLWDIDLDEVTDFGVADKSKFHWISMIRLPEFATEEVFEWAKQRFAAKKPEADVSRAVYLSFAEGLCAQVMHIGSFDEEMVTVDKLRDFVDKSGYGEDFDMAKYRYHHEIYLGDPRKSKLENLKTVIRHPIKKR
ncbi:GyrI-like domain-containing protein [Christensenellaceae bacterium OttesenSCG-928-L17]|nr:GyrI-like domain-containing protein [Christensenellaceae bacterium OttesenSCG-928-L17]